MRESRCVNQGGKFIVPEFACWADERSIQFLAYFQALHMMRYQRTPPTKCSSFNVSIVNTIQLLRNELEQWLLLLSGHGSARLILAMQARLVRDSQMQEMGIQISYHQKQLEASLTIRSVRRGVTGYVIRVIHLETHFSGVLDTKRRRNHTN